MGENLADRVLEAAERGSDLKDALEERQADFQETLEERRTDFQEGLDGLREDLSRRRADYQQRQEQRAAAAREQLEELRQRLEELLDADGFGQRRLLSAFPKMRSIDHKNALERLRRRMEQRRRGKKD